MKIFDSLVSLVSGLGTMRDKAATVFYSPVVVNQVELNDAYRGTWLARKIVDIPAQDATRKWRAWQTDKKSIELIEAEEKRLNLRQKTRDAMIKARQQGAAVIYIGTKDNDLSEPLRPERMGKQDVRYLTVLGPRDITPGELDTDPASPYFRQPKFYRMGGTTGSSLEIHPTRLAIFLGAKLPDDNVYSGSQWNADPVLVSMLDAMKNSDSTMANVASLVFEAKVDIFKVKGLMENAGNKKWIEQFLARYQLAAMAKGNNGALITDANEEYDSKTMQFGGLDALIDRFMQAVSGAADIPATRLLGQSPSGLTSAGESDLRNYYDRILSMQELDVSPALTVLDECLIRSATGKRDPMVHYVWQSLWQTTPKERAEIGKTTADTLKTLNDSKLYHADALAKAGVVMLTETGTLPGLEAALSESRPDDTDEAVVISDSSKVEPLYVSRKVMNATEILAWAKAQGFGETLTADDLHVTIAYSRTAVDWLAMGTTWTGDDQGMHTVKAGGPRFVDRFGDAVVLVFASSDLSWRHREMVEAGASWDHDEYQPHITIAYNAPDVDVRAIEPYRGVIELGPEIFESIKEDWSNGKP